ncbi:hypothetical protein PFICI_10767 [Pestalotiopsis fici W106-1]|uniref:GED domain-containing protein n=1 Tax=Pestalotiopsis fici (strain W106-1 / CGMCC3.15140) TaxID=1229662 RepID=W3WSQ1_PESFW|nr:uncharacterized protein PFICI_10767 [Pestalotiopsis fici W106-1]ETS76893.1 hypothetical protein PFICI_10767 [Pestalotiopsis fici W106-1]
MTVDTADEAPPITFDGLCSVESTDRLNLIDKVRANGVGGIISLPQLVVCGDQSAGKSSVLERLTKIPFPRSDSLCTRFPTEIIIRHTSGARQVIATIQPHETRSADIQESLKSYQRNIDDFSELPSVIKEVSKLMRIRGFTSEEECGGAFASDTLRIEVSGPNGLSLTVVDLPGLISVSHEGQTEEDVAMVRRMAESYLESSRTIILAVLQASNDVANQGIVQLARKHDPDGQRTVGIITKPDLINAGTEAKIARLANNVDNIKLKLGFFLLKNPSPSEIGLSGDAQCQLESQFFATAIWQSHCLDMTRVGISELRTFLQQLLDRHIEKELPKVQNEVKQLLMATDTRLATLGPERTTALQIRGFLTGTSMRFHGLIIAALYGNYQGSEARFFERDANRLRAMVHQANETFADYMRTNGAKRKLVEEKEDQPNQEDESEIILATKTELSQWITERYTATRGRELPGNVNGVLLSELFCEQSSRWGQISENHVATVTQIVTDWMREALALVAEEEHVRNQISSICQKSLNSAIRDSAKELRKLLSDEKRPPMTYNHYYTDNVQKARNDAGAKKWQQAVKAAQNEEWSGKMNINMKELAKFPRFFASVNVNMTQTACADAETGLTSYYKVAMKIFVDNVCRQVLERHILRSMSELFTPTTVAQFSDEELLRIGAETEGRRRDREHLTQRASALRKSLQDLRGYESRQLAL